MKKNYYELISEVCKIWRSKFLKKMRIIVLLILISITQTFALDGYAQSKRLSLSVKNETIVNILEDIEDQSEFYFMYDASRINVNQRKTVDCENQSIRNILDQLFEKTGITYTIKDRQVLLTTINKSEIEQQKTVSGKVTDSAGSPLPGVTVVIKGTTKGTITDIDGDYSLNNVPNNAVLVFSFVGMKNQEVKVDGQSTINISLSQNTIVIEEVVVIGYGTQKKEDATGAVQNVSSEDFNTGIISSPEQLLTGKVAGISIVSNSGEPGGQVQVRLRGGTSINAGNEPLYVIDNVPIDNSPYNPDGFSAGRNPLNSINPSDIKDITVLKDASATAIYGSRGANGVIIIRTKRGEIGKSGVQSLSYSGNVSISSISKEYDVLSASEFREAIEKFAPQRENLLGDYSTNWQDKIFRDAISQTHDFSIIGGAEKMSYRISLGSQDQQGIIKRSSSKRNSASVAFNQNLFEDMLELVGNIRIAKTKDYFSKSGTIQNAILFDPTQPVKSGDESKYGGYFEYVGELTRSNPVALLEQNDDDAEGIRSLGNIELKYKLHFYPKISVKANLGYDIANGLRKSYIPLVAKGSAILGTDKGEIRKTAYFRNSNLLETYLAYDNQIKAIKSKINAIVGYSYQQFINEYSSFRATELSSDILGYNSTSSASNFDASTSKQGNKLISFWGRINYNFDERYLLTLTLREDGSSRFSKSNRWGSFPSASFAWRVTEESFMKNLSAGKILSSLKLRAGWGITGNQEIGDYRYLPTYTLGDSKSTVQFGDQFINTLRPNGVDKNLKWEETSQINVGLDFGFFNNRLNGSVDLYKKDTKDLLFTVAVPQPFLNTRVLTNIGKVQNKGIEFSFDSYLISKQKLKWNVAFNIAYNKNEIIKLDNNDDPNFQGYEVGSTGLSGNNIQILKKGESVNSFFVYEHIMEEGKPIYRDVNGDGAVNTLDIYKDQNNDGKINVEDKIIKGSSEPDITFGVSSSLDFGKFDLSFVFKGLLGNYIYNNVAANNSLSWLTSEAYPNNILRSSLELGFAERQYFSSYFVENASFISLDNITLGYSLKIPSTNIHSRIYCTAQNLLLITGYKGLDPESTEVNQRGIDNNLYPRSRTILFGLNLNF